MKDVRFTHSFRFRLMSMLFLLILIPILTIGFVVFTVFEDILTRKISESALQSITQGARNIDFTLDNLLTFTNGMLTNRRFITLMKNPKVADVNEIENMLRGFFSSSEGVEGLNVRIGQEIHFVGTILPMSDFDGSELFAKVEGSHGEIVWGRTRRETIRTMSGDADNWCFSVNRKIVDIFTLEEFGIMQIDVDEAVLAGAFGQSGSDEIETLLVDREGYVVSHADKEQIGTLRLDYRPVAEALGKQSESGWFNGTVAGNEAVVIYATVGSSDWRLVRVIPSSYLFREVNQVRLWVFAGGAVMLLLASGIALLFSNNLTQPLTLLMRKMREAEDGNLDVVVDLRRGDDEIAQLGHSFQEMLVKIRELMARSIEREKQKQEIELEALHAQINPHFLYNTLNSVKWMAKMAGAQNISKTITALVKLLRISINLSHDRISLSEEIEHVKNYVFIQKIRFNEHFEVIYDIPPECTGLKMPKLLLQPLVENAIVHGFPEDDSGNLVVRITAERTEKDLFIRVADNGKGISDEDIVRIQAPGNITRFSSVGLKNVSERIRLYCGEDYGLQLESREGEGTVVVLHLPADEGEPEESLPTAPERKEEDDV